MYQLMNRLLCYQVAGKTVWKTNTIKFCCILLIQKALREEMLYKSTEYL